MKKMLTYIVVLLVGTMLINTSTYATTIRTASDNEKVSFIIQDVVGYAKAYGIRADDCITKIPLKLKIDNDNSTNLVVSIAADKSKSSGGTLNFTVSGSFQKTSNSEVVTVYGLSGSFEYTGSDTDITGSSSYHTSCLDGWTGSSSTKTSYDEDNYHISVLEGDYTLYYKSKKNNSAEIKIAVSEDGIYSVGGDYYSYDVN